jgi:hypothetical protein
MRPRKGKEMPTIGGGGSSKRDNAVSRLDNAVGSSTLLSDEIAKIANNIRDNLLGCPPPSNPTTEKLIETPPGAGFIGNITIRQETTNRALNYALDVLRTVLGEIS